MDALLRTAFLVQVLEGAWQQQFVKANGRTKQKRQVLVKYLPLLLAWIGDANYLKAR